ncbi:outer membrane transport energization protein TonB [Methylophilus rhizosphaerae]|uniref:Outer membrane transport energization protein TonB n=1 Tax=Methylophilus rhizosphaerae TaxID=492660 RepID=A0A1G8ZFA8_9PROT|nr:energy transducer TonB [Methylophilus rhizosphaerae]SDK13643.1 outer membrane transport energization protein TonB [Methylophilus rhizosphaerae]
MTSLAFNHGVHAGRADDTQVWRAVILSLALHALVVVIYPHLSQVRLPDVPDRLEIEFFSVKAPAPSARQQEVVEPVSTPAPPEPPKPVQKPVVTPTPVPTPKQVLAAPVNHEAEYRVPEQTQAKAEPEPVKVEPAPAPAVTAPSVPSPVENQHSSEEQTAKEARSATSGSVRTNSESDELTANDNDAWGDYGEQLRALVNKSKQYPTIAIRRHLEGEVTVVAQFTRGELTQVSLAESSKHVPLDEEAMRMVKKAIQQLGMKDSLRSKTFRITIPVSFKLE